MSNWKKLFQRIEGTAKLFRADGYLASMGVEGGTIHDQVSSVPDLLNKINSTMQNGIEVGILSVHPTIKTVKLY